MSDIKRRLAKIDGALDQSAAPSWVRAMTDEQLVAEMAAMAARPGRGLDATTLGAPRPCLQHLSDGEVLAELEQARAALAASKGRTT